jgi:KDO2-lipid IV(A) lauroyltransferase
VRGDRSGLRAWIEYLAYRGAAGLVGRLPDGARAAVAAGAGRLAHAIERRRSAVARSYLIQAFGAAMSESERERLILAAWRHLALVVMEGAAFNRRVLGSSLADHFDVDLSTDAGRVLAAGTGGFFVTPHVGMWEALPVIGATLGFRPAYVVSRPPRNRPLSRHAQVEREARGYRLVPRRGAVDDIKTAVTAGAWVGLMLDQRPWYKTVVAPFFGRPAHCERVVPILARRLGRPIVFGACYRTDRPFHYLAVIDRVLRPEEVAGLEPGVIAALINREMERLILRAPEQYLWFHDRYRRPRWLPSSPTP